MLTSVYGSPLKLQTQRSCSLISKHAPTIEEFVVEHESFSFPWRWIVISCILYIFLNVKFQDAAANLNSRLLCISILLSVFGSIFFGYNTRKESLVVIHGIGLISSNTSGMWNKTISFIAWENVEGIVLFEAISWNRIFYHMGLLVKNRKSEQLVSNIFPMFKDSAPRLECLQAMYGRLNALFER